MPLSERLRRCIAPECWCQGAVSPFMKPTLTAWGSEQWIPYPNSKQF
jgi:hypothetical protein